MAVPGNIPPERWCCAEPDIPSGCGEHNPMHHVACVCENCGGVYPHVHPENKTQVLREGVLVQSLYPFLPTYTPDTHPWSRD